MERPEASSRRDQVTGHLVGMVRFGVLFLVKQTGIGDLKQGRAVIYLRFQ